MKKEIALGSIVIINTTHMCMALSVRGINNIDLTKEPHMPHTHKNLLFYVG